MDLGACSQIALTRLTLSARGRPPLSDWWDRPCPCTSFQDDPEPSSLEELHTRLRAAVLQCKCEDKTRLRAAVAPLFARYYSWEDTDGVHKSLNKQQQRALCMHVQLPDDKLDSIILGRMRLVPALSLARGLLDVVRFGHCQLTVVCF